MKLAAIEARIVACERCPELRAYCARIAQEKKRAYRDQPYWGKPVPAFGDPNARLLLAGFANQPTQRDRNDGLVLNDCLITAALHCAPPKNAPTPAQKRNCAPYLVEEIATLTNLRLVIGLGAIGTTSAIQALVNSGYTFPAPKKFAHAAESQALHPTRPPLTLLASYHPSQQNTNTGVLTEPMLDAIFTRAKTLLANP